MNFDPTCSSCHRRRFIHRITLGSAAFFTAPGAFAEALSQTPFQTEGPFYPDKLPLDTDNDLLRINDNITPAVGEITHLTGTVRDIKGNLVRNAVVEAWEADSKGNYIHSRGFSDKTRDTNFQGYGRFLTGSKGEYYFRTIKPVPYGPRTPHIHMAVSQKGKRMLTTQCYVKGHKLNETDRILNSVKDMKARESLLVDFKPVEGSKTGELTAHFDIIIGFTPEDRARDTGRRRRQDGRPRGRGRGRPQPEE